MKTALVKAGLTLADRLGRRAYNSDPPPVGRMIASVPYGTASPEQALDIIVPVGTGPYPVLINLHGGGWLMGDKASYTRICRSFAAKGVLVCNVNYRLAPRSIYPTQLLDAAQAIAWVSAHAIEYGGDPQCLFLMGDSAGAQLALWYAASFNSEELQAITLETPLVPVESIRGLLLFYGVYEIAGLRSAFGGQGGVLAEAFLGSDRAQFAARNQIASPIYHLHRALPPLFVCCGQRDTLYSQSLDLLSALQAMGVEHEQLLLSAADYPHARHGFLNFHRQPASQLALTRATSFLLSRSAPR